MKLSKTLIVALIASIAILFAALIQSEQVKGVKSNVKNSYAKKNILTKDYSAPSKSYRWFSGR